MALDKNRISSDTNKAEAMDQAITTLTGLGFNFTEGVFKNYKAVADPIDVNKYRVYTWDPTTKINITAHDTTNNGGSFTPSIPSGNQMLTGAQIQLKGMVDSIFDIISREVVKEIVDHLELKGIRVTTGNLLPGPPTVTASDGGATLFTATLQPGINSQDLQQNNDGEGLVA